MASRKRSKSKSKAGKIWRKGYTTKAGKRVKGTYVKKSRRKSKSKARRRKSKSKSRRRKSKKKVSRRRKSKKKKSRRKSRRRSASRKKKLTAPQAFKRGMMKNYFDVNFPYQEKSDGLPKMRSPKKR